MHVISNLNIEELAVLVEKVTERVDAVEKDSN